MSLAWKPFAHLCGTMHSPSLVTIVCGHKNWCIIDLFCILQTSAPWMSGADPSTPPESTLVGLAVRNTSLGLFNGGLPIHCDNTQPWYLEVINRVRCCYCTYYTSICLDRQGYVGPVTFHMQCWCFLLRPVSVFCAVTAVKFDNLRWLLQARLILECY